MMQSIMVGGAASPYLVLPLSNHNRPQASSAFGARLQLEPPIHLNQPDLAAWNQLKQGLKDILNVRSLVERTSEEFKITPGGLNVVTHVTDLELGSPKRVAGGRTGQHNTMTTLTTQQSAQVAQLLTAYTDSPKQGFRFIGDA
jgi:hypothetical protein